jgi:hypothetical protein
MERETSAVREYLGRFAVCNRHGIAWLCLASRVGSWIRSHKLTLYCNAEHRAYGAEVHLELENLSRDTGFQPVRAAQD